MQFSSSEVCEILKIKRHRLHVWVENKWVSPSIRIADGPGTRNKYNKFDIISISIFKMLVESGMLREYSGLIVNEWIKESAKGLNKEIVVRASGLPFCWLEVCKYKDEKFKSDLLLKPRLYNPDAIQVVAINIKDLVTKVDEAIDKMD